LRKYLTLLTANVDNEQIAVEDTDLQWTETMSYQLYNFDQSSSTVSLSFDALSVI